MRKIYENLSRVTSSHTGTPFHAGRAVFQALRAQSFTDSRRGGRENTKPSFTRWFEQTGRSRSSIRPFDEVEKSDLLDKQDSDDSALQAFEDGLRELENTPDNFSEADIERFLKEEVGEEEDLEVEDGAQPGTTEQSLEEEEMDLLKSLRGEQDKQNPRELELDDLEERFQADLKSLGQELDSLDDDSPEQQGGEGSGDDVAGGTELSEEEALAYQRDLKLQEQKIQKELEELQASMKKFDNIEETLMAKEEETSPESTLATNLGLQRGGFSGEDMGALEMEFRMPQIVRKQVKTFNDSLKLVASHPTHIFHRRTLWVNYLRCQRNIPGFLEQVTDSAWKVLWDSQASEPFYDEQAEHLLTLAENMRQIRRPLSGMQKILCIKAYEADKRYQKAADMWYQEKASLQKDKHLRFEFNALGVSLECIMKRPAKAEAIALGGIARDGNDSGAARLLFPVIGAWAREGDEASIKRAWGLYVYARQSLARQARQENHMTAEDHDEIFLGFLDAGRRDMALMVFKDLILSGQESRYDSTRILKSMGIGLERLHSSLNNPEDLNRISLDALTVLPKRFENKYFYASWLKRLIGMGRIDAAASVVELMYERGISPDPKHLNGIISFWLRQGSQKEQDQALDLAWSMVEERFKLVEQRHLRRGTTPGSKSAAANYSRLPKHLRRRVPSASTETFCLLLLYYTNRNSNKEVDTVKQLLSETELAPNSYFMNHLMVSYLNQKKPSQAWELFTKMSSKTRPDTTSFEILWSLADKLTNVYEQMDQFPGPRRLFSTMMNWMSQLPPKEKNAALKEPNDRLYNHVVRTFCNWKDLNGTLAAMYGLRDSFGLYPDDQSIRQISILVAQAAEKRQAPHALGRSRTRRRRKPTSDTNSNIESAGRVLGMIFDNRTADLREQNVSIEELDEHQQGEERLYLLSEFLRAAQRQQVSSPESAETQELSEEFDKVVWEMGAGPFKMGPPVYDSRALKATTIHVQ